MRHVLAVLSALLLVSCARWARQPRFGSLSRDERPFSFKHNIELIEVSNGLRVALIHDDRSNLATVDLRYDVGAAEDPAGRAGMAHLVEHVVFELRNEPGGPTLGEELGELALYTNAFTSWDYTHYATQVPIEHLADALRLEARRMRAPCDQLDEATFERERDVVRNEGRERISPATETMQSILAEVYGKDHPYTRPISSDEIAAATRDEVCAFIEKNYTPDRASLVITGPYNVAETKALVGKTFGPIVRKSAGPRAPIAAPHFDGRTTRRTAPVTRPTALVYLTYPAWGADGASKFLLGKMALAAALESADDDNGWITATDVYVAGGWRAPVLVASVEVSDESRLDDAASEVFRQAGELLEGVSPATLSPVLGSMEMAYVESWDDLPSRGMWIAEFMQYTDHNWFMLKEMRAITDTNWHAAIEQLQNTMMPQHSHVVLLTPGGDATRAKATALPSASHNLTPWRAPVDPADAERPVEIDGALSRMNVEEYTLANGLIVQLAPDPSSPMIDARLVFPVGRAHEPADRPYLATAAVKLLSNDLEGYYDRVTYDQLEWSLSHGTEYTTEVDETSTTFAVRGLAQWGDWHVWFLSWLLDQGRYNDATIKGMHDLALSKGEREDDDIDPAARIFLERLFGKGHPYALPAPDIGNAFLAIDAADLERWRSQHFLARGATLVVSGAFDVTAMKREIEELFGPWSGAIPGFVPSIPKPHPARGPSWIAVDNEEASQTTILMGFATASDAQRDEAARAVVEEMINDGLRDIREGMGASYGVQAKYLSGAAGGVLRVSGDVDEAKSGAVLVRVLDILAEVRAGGDAQREAFVRARKKALAQAMGRMGGATAIAAELAANAAAGQSVRHANIVATQISALRLEDVARVAAEDLVDERRVVLLSGKRASVDAAYGEISVTPERAKARDKRKDADQPTDDVEPEPGTKPTTASPPKPHRPADGVRLSVDLIDENTGLTRKGLFLGDKEISLDAFLRYAGEDDLANDVRKRRWIKRGMVWGGVATMGLGVIVAITGRSCDGIEPFSEREDCYNAKSARKSKGVALLALGGVAAALSIEVSSGKPSDSQLRTIAARYNRVVVAPEVNEHGGGVSVSGEF